MVELQSSEILEREILEDARKKALRILKTAEETINSKNAEWEKKTADTVNDLEEKNNEQKKQITEKIMARLPIDKLRSRIEKIEDLLNYAVETWYHNLNKEQILGLLKKELSDRLAVNSEISNSINKNAYYRSLERADVESLLKSLNVNFPVEEKASAGYFPSITLETESTRIIASIQDLIDYYLLEKREELIEAMMGQKFLEDMQL